MLSSGEISNAIRSHAVRIIVFGKGAANRGLGWRNVIASAGYRPVEELQGVTIFAFDDASVPHYARARVHLENEGKRLADPDMRIAAIALAYGLTLISGNVRHFARIPGLAVEDWTAP